VIPREGYAVGLDGSPIFFRVFDGPAANAGAPDDGSAQTLVLCDGIGCDGYVWKYLLPALWPRYRLVHWHYRGHGRTPEPRDRQRLGIPDLADDLAAVLTEVGAPQATLLGHSMGVQVCLETYRRHADRVTGLVLMCGSYGTPLRTFKGTSTLESALPWVSFAVGRMPKLTAALLRMAVPTRFAYALATRLEVNGDLLHIDDFMPYLEHIGRLDPTLFLGMLAHAGRHSARDLLPLIDVPTLIVGGERDGFTPAALSREMVEVIPDAELLMVPDGSHTAPLERPELVTQVVTRFLAERVARGPGAAKAATGPTTDAVTTPARG
jgi:pimeloyl-ACP methyl ester carboxylesterase